METGIKLKVHKDTLIFFFFFNSESPFCLFKAELPREVSIVSESDCHLVFQDLRGAEVLFFLHLILLIDSKAHFPTSQILVCWL